MVTTNYVCTTVPFQSTSYVLLKIQRKNYGRPVSSLTECFTLSQCPNVFVKVVAPYAAQ